MVGFSLYNYILYAKMRYYFFPKGFFCSGFAAGFGAGCGAGCGFATGFATGFLFSIKFSSFQK
jgi:hypothetical protein